MKSHWFPNGFFDINMIEADGKHIARVYLRGMDDTRALMAESIFENQDLAFRNAIDKALDQIAVLGRKVQEARTPKPAVD
jgi:hypothetical protein